MGSGPRRLPVVSSFPSVETVFPAGGALAFGWRLARIDVGPDELRVHADRDDCSIAFRVTPSEEGEAGGGFDIEGVRIRAEAGPISPEELEEVGKSLSARLGQTENPGAFVQGWLAGAARRRLSEVLTLAGADTNEGVQQPESTGDWRTGRWKAAARQMLVGKRSAGVRLERLVNPESLPPWACVEPWTRLEFHTGGSYGPCCASYLVSADRLRASGDPAALWNGEGLRSFRRSMVRGDLAGLCSDSCPVLRGRSDVPGRIELRGGPEPFVEAQLRLVEELLEGRDTLESGPLIVCLPTTTYCNYDCLMCKFGSEGTLADELPPEFYASLRRFGPGLQRIEALGGEPLASPVFREYLATEDFSRWPGLEITLITNGSYLTPKEQLRHARVPMNLVVSLNAATEKTYAEVNRGLPFGRIRENLDHLLARRKSGDFKGSLVYSMVLLNQNLHEIRAFAEMARADGVKFRFMLPVGNRNETSLFTTNRAMRTALAELEALLAEERQRGAEDSAATLNGEVEVLRTKVAEGVEEPPPPPPAWVLKLQWAVREGRELLIRSPPKAREATPLQWATVVLMTVAAALGLALTLG